MDRIQFTLPIEPTPKGRPRLGRRGVYTPQKTRDFEREIATRAKQYAPIPILSGPLTVILNFFITRPKSVKRAHAMSKPDLDNLAKAVTDALNKIIWNDDSQICELWAFKAYAPVGRIEVDIQDFKERQHRVLQEMSSS
jgi:Holliday junction resolvase RusA-like endonuclease